MAKSYELTEAIAALIHKQSFFAVLLMDLLEIVETESLPTAGTDGKYLYVNPLWFKSNRCKNVDERMFTLAHEIVHVITEHPTRLKYYMDLGFGPDLKPFNKTKANHAMDYVINDMLIHDKIGQPPIGALINPQFDRTMIWDEVYLQLPDDPEPPDGQGGDQWDEHMGADPATAPNKATIQRAVQSAAAAAKSQGQMPGSMQKLVDDLCEPQVTWQDHIRRAITAATGREHQTWVRPNRRRLAVAPHVYWPGTTGTQAGCIVSVNDTSGSVSDKEQAGFFAELHSILSDLQPKPLYVMFVDAAVHAVHELYDVNDLLELKNQVQGGGGTDMTVAFREFDKLATKPETCIVFTDGDTPFGEDTGVPTIWCITGDHVAPWGTTVHIKITH